MVAESGLLAVVIIEVFPRYLEESTEPNRVEAVLAIPHLEIDSVYSASQFED